MDDPTDVPTTPKAPTDSRRKGRLLGGLVAVLVGLVALIGVEYCLGWLDTDPMRKLRGAMPHVDKDSAGSPPRARGRNRGATPKAKAEETTKE